MAERPVLLIQMREPRPFVEEFAQRMPALEVRVWPEIGAPEDIAFAFVSRIKPGVLGSLPNLKFVASLLAGVEHLVGNPEIPPGMPIVRTGSPDGDAMMTEYVLMHVLRHHRNLPAYAIQQGRAEWGGFPQKPAGERGVGFLGVPGIMVSRSVHGREIRDRKPESPVSAGPKDWIPCLPVLKSW
jgi:phosphoglycerate dehydrogenase-like enzyme